ncbi:MAG: thioredoxin family protein [Bacteroidota bacterium]
MKKILLILPLIIFSLAPGFAGEKAELKWRTFDEASAQASKSKKKVLVDVYTDWCKWCKKMDADTYSDSTVMNYLNKKFVVAKLNAESEDQVTFEGEKHTSAEFAQMLGVKGYPTIVFFGPDGKVITALSTYLDAEKFLHVVKFIGDDKYEKMNFDEFEKQYKD